MLMCDRRRRGCRRCRKARDSGAGGADGVGGVAGVNYVGRDAGRDDSVVTGTANDRVVSRRDGQQVLWLIKWESR